MSNIKRVTGINGFMQYPKKASTAFIKGALVKLVSGVLEPANASTTPAQLVGVALKDVTDTDSDYATAGVKMQIENIFDDTTAEYQLEIGAGTYADTMIGGRFDLDANGLADLGNSNEEVFEVVREATVATGETPAVIVRFIKA